MKWIFAVMIFLQGWALGMEVRSYRVGKAMFLRVCEEAVGENVAREGDPFAEENGGIRPLVSSGKRVVEAPFESRFLKGGEEFWDYSDAVAGLLTGTGKGWKGMAVLDEKGGQLVVKAEAGDHEELAVILGRRFEKMVRTGVSLYAVQGVELGMRSGGREELKRVKGGRFLYGLSGVHLAGQTLEMRSEDGEFEVLGEAQFEEHDDVIDCRYAWRSEMEGAEFEVKSGLLTRRGMPAMVGLGSIGGEETLVVVLEQELVLGDGTLWDEWILKEKGGAFLREERLAGRGETEPLKIEGVRSFTLWPTFFDMLVTPVGWGRREVDEDPFAVGPETRQKEGRRLYEGSDPELKRLARHQLYDVTDLFRKNGVSFEEGEFAVFLEKESTLLVKASKESLALLEGIVKGRPTLPRVLSFSFVRVEADGEVDVKRLKEGDYELVEKVGLSVLPGQNGKIRLGEGLTVEVEAQIDGDDDLVDTRMVLARGGDLEEADFKTGVGLTSGVSVVVQQSRVGEKWEAWVVTAEIVTVGGAENLE